MSKVFASIKIFPKSIETDLNQLKEKIKNILPEGSSLHSFQEEPIAFGLVALKLNVIVGDVGGILDEIEELLISQEEISEIQVEGATRV